MKNEDETADIAEAIDVLACRVKRVADAITPNIPGSNDATDLHVESLTEAVMGMTSGLVQIGNAISDLAQAVASLKD